eukprot:TRINITY_DN10499_c0_g1_i1.p1 TRINITY_DN10499_c0_g1~~TRINITY_DN10499_c0_g1_i1.p1  ORF type:complete len:139 (+),score=18.58 TRINITY_DN10499_c0_g1_i1:54-470(+)
MFDLRKNKSVFELMIGSYAMTFDPFRRKLFASSTSGSVLALDYQTWIARESSMMAHTKSTWCIASDKQKIITGSRDGFVKIWDPDSLKCLYAIPGTEGWVNAFVYDEISLITASGDGFLTCCDFSAIDKKKGAYCSVQ